MALGALRSASEAKCRVASGTRLINVADSAQALERRPIAVGPDARASDDERRLTLHC